MNPIQSLINAGIPRKKIIEQTKLKYPEISMILNGKRSPSWRQRKAFYDAFGIDPKEWDQESVL